MYIYKGLNQLFLKKKIRKIIMSMGLLAPTCTRKFDQISDGMEANDTKRIGVGILLITTLEVMANDINLGIDVDINQLTKFISEK